MFYLKQSTAVTLKIGPFLDNTDGYTAETALTIAQADVRLSKNGANIAQKTEATSCTHDEIGVYGCPVDATDTSTLGRLQLWVHESGALPVFHEYMVLPANIYDSLCSTDKLQVDAVQLAGVTQSLTDLKDFADAGYDPAANKINGVVLVDTTTTNSDMVGTANAALAATALSTATWTAARAAALTDWINGGRLDLILDIIAADTTTDIPALIATAQADLNILTGADGATLATAQANYAPNKVVPDAAGVAPTAAEIKTSIEQAGSSIAQILADTNAIQTDWVNGGRLDLILDIIAADTTTDIPALIATAQADLNILTGADGATLATAQANYAPNKVVPDAAGVAPTAAENADALWDEILSGATHNIANSAGRRLREVGAYAIQSGTAQAGNSVHITLAATASADDGIYNRNLIVITDNTGAGQTRTIVDYNGTSKIALVDRDWRVTPDATSEYQIVPDDTPLVVDHGLATAGSTNTITLRSYASAIDNIYNGSIVTILAGTGRGQSGIVDDYNGTTKVVTMCLDWVVTPDTTSVYVIMPYGASAVACIYDSALDSIHDEVIEGTLTDREMKRINHAVLAGKSTGGGTSTLVFRDDADAKARVTATVDSSGNRTAITKDGA